MRLLLVSDEPENKSYQTIELLVDDIEKILKGTTIDQMILSNNSLFIKKFNQVLQVTSNEKQVEPIIDLLKNEYNICAVTLTRKNAKWLFFGKMDFINLIFSASSGTILSAFVGASLISRLETISQKSGITHYFYPRRGVAKISKEWKNHLFWIINKYNE